MTWRMAITVLMTSAAWGTVVDRIAVTVGKDVITETEVMEEIRVIALLNGEPPDFSPEARRRAADRLVDQTLIRREMEIGDYPEPDDNEVAGMLRNLKQKQFHGDAGYRAALERYGVTEDVLKTHLKWQAAAVRFTEERFRTGALPPPTGQEPARRNGSADRASPPPGATGQRPRSGMRANRADRTAGVDEQMDSWLRDARDRTRVVYMKEAFQ